MKNSFWYSLSIILAGVSILLLPDNGERLISFNKDHGPSLQDVIGLLFITGGWLYWVINIILQWKKIYHKFKSQGILLLALILVCGSACIIIGLKNETDWPLYTGIVLSILSYLFPVIPAFKRNDQ